MPSSFSIFQRNSTTRQKEISPSAMAKYFRGLESELRKLGQSYSVTQLLWQECNRAYDEGRHNNSYEMYEKFLECYNQCKTQSQEIDDRLQNVRNQLDWYNQHLHTEVGTNRSQTQRVEDPRWYKVSEHTLEELNLCFKYLHFLDSGGKFKQALIATLKKHWLDTFKSPLSNVINIEKKQLTVNLLHAISLCEMVEGTIQYQLEKDHYYHLRIALLSFPEFEVVSSSSLSEELQERVVKAITAIKYQGIYPYEEVRLNSLMPIIREIVRAKQSMIEELNEIIEGQRTKERLAAHSPTSEELSRIQELNQIIDRRRKKQREKEESPITVMGHPGLSSPSLTTFGTDRHLLPAKKRLRTEDANQTPGTLENNISIVT